MKTHIPAGDRTYCGRAIIRIGNNPLEWSPSCIDLRRTCIEEATCRVCQSSDDRRVVEQYRREIGWPE